MCVCVCVCARMHACVCVCVCTNFYDLKYKRTISSHFARGVSDQDGIQNRQFPKDSIRMVICNV